MSKHDPQPVPPDHPGESDLSYWLGAGKPAASWKEAMLRENHFPSAPPQADPNDTRVLTPFATLRR